MNERTHDIGSTLPRDLGFIDQKIRREYITAVNGDDLVTQLSKREVNRAAIATEKTMCFSGLGLTRCVACSLRHSTSVSEL